MDKTKLKISILLNILIVALTIFASTVMFTGLKFMHGVEPVLESTKLGMFRFFTVDSNMLIGLVALIFAIKEMQVLSGKIKEIPVKYYLLKLMATTGVGLTFLVVFAYLGPISKGGIPSMLQNSNLFLHLLIPVLSMLNFALFESTDKIKAKYVAVGMIPAAAYAIYYLINILIHMENGRVSPLYDWYWFVQGGLWQIVVVMPVILGMSYLTSLILWKINKMNKRKES